MCMCTRTEHIIVIVSPYSPTPPFICMIKGLKA